MRKGKRYLAAFIAALLLIPVLSLPAMAAEPQKIPVFQNNPFVIQVVKQASDEKALADFLTKYSSNRPFSAELFAHFLCGSGDRAYWEEDVPAHIKDEIFDNEKIQEKLQYVLERAYSAGNWKVVYIFNEETPAYYDPDIFSEEPFLDKEGLAFVSHDMSTAVGHINGRLIIGADYLGGNKFSVWVSLSDLYDFNYSYDWNLGSLGLAANIAAAFQQTGLANTFNLTIGFTRTYEWTPPAPEAPAAPAAAAAQPSSPVPQPQTSSQQSAASQFYARQNYDIGNYTGDMLQGKPHGYGTLEYSSQTKYQIEMMDGTWSKAAKYTGSWVNGIRCGQGTFTFANGIQYEGVWNTDGYYFKGYVKSAHYRQYIEQTASGDTITTVYSMPVERIG